MEFAEIYNILKAGMNVAERARFEQITQLVESLYAQVSALHHCAPTVLHRDQQQLQQPPLTTTTNK